MKQGTKIYVLINRTSLNHCSLSLFTCKCRDTQRNLHLDVARSWSTEWKWPIEAIVSFGSENPCEVKH